MQWYFWVPLVVLLIAQATWIFRDARRRGENQWLWGFFGLLNVPTSLLVYLLVTRMNDPRCASCGLRQPPGVARCRRCGQPLSGVCQGCGRALRREWCWCPHCGWKIVAS